MAVRNLRWDDHYVHIFFLLLLDSFLHFFLPRTPTSFVSDGLRTGSQIAESRSAKRNLLFKSELRYAEMQMCDISMTTSLRLRLTDLYSANVSNTELLDTRKARGYGDGSVSQGKYCSLIRKSA